MLLATSTTLLQKKQQRPNIPTTSGPTYHRKSHQLLNETFYVTIPKRATNHTSICPLKIPASCVPTTQTHLGKYLDISYELFVVIPSLDSNSATIDSSNLSQLLLNPQVIRLPLFITTVPYSSSSLPVIDIPFADDEHNNDLPIFLSSSTHGSPLTAGSDWGSGSPISDSFNEDTSGHLLVPPITSRRSLSIHSSQSH